MREARVNVHGSVDRRAPDEQAPLPGGAATEGRRRITVVGREPARSLLPSWGEYGRGWLEPVALVLLAAFVVAALTHALLGLGGRTYSANALVLVKPDRVERSGTNTASAELSDRFVQGQILLLKAPQLLSNILQGRPASDPRPALAVRQVGLTDVVELQVTAADRELAAQVANELAERYVEQDEVQAQEAAEREAVILRRLLSQLDAEATGGSGPATSAAGTEYARLQAQLNELQRAASDPDGARLLTPASPASATTQDARGRNAALAGLLTAGAVTGLLVLRRRRRLLETVA